MSLGTALGRLERDLGDLLARHERGRDLTEFERYADDPVGFIRDVLGGDPWAKQIEIALAVRDHPLVVVRGCNSSGKDWVAAGIALWAVYALGALVLITGPTERQVREIVMGEVARFFFAARDLPGELFQGALRLRQAGLELAGPWSLFPKQPARREVENTDQPDPRVARITIYGYLYHLAIPAGSVNEPSARRHAALQSQAIPRWPLLTRRLPRDPHAAFTGWWEVSGGNAQRRRSCGSVVGLDDRHVRAG